MKPLPTEVLKAPISIIVTVFSLLSLFFLLLTHRSSSPDQSPRRPFTSKVTAIPKRPPLLPPRWVERMGIVDDFGAMAEEFLVGDYDPALVLEWANFSGHQRRIGGGGGVLAAPVESYGICEESMRDYIPCLDSMEIGSVNSGSRGEKYERHCPPLGEGLNCLVPPPEGYRKPVPWPQSRNKVEDDKGGPNMTISNRDKFIFPGRADYYVNQISQMVPEIAFGNQTRVVLDIGRGEASFGYILSQHNVTTLSIAPQDDNENPIQLVLDRGLPAMVAVFGTHRLLYPSQAFDLIHCHRCTINWTRDDGILLLEANRILRAGGYFVWSPQPTKNHENLEVQWKEIKDLTSRICWKLVRKEKEIGIWQKVFNNTCYFNRDTGVQPSICDSDDDPDNVWYINLKSCITLLPKNCYGANVTSWPARLHHLPDRLQSIKIDAQVSRKEIFIAESKYWNEIIDGYVRAYHWKELKFRNVMDMRAGFGGFAAALLDFQIVCWVMNVVPVSGFNTLPVIYDRGLIGVAHDWCEPFDTYPRSYDLLHAAGLFSTEQKRCNISTIMLEMDRMLRPSGHVYIHDSVSVIGQVKEIATAMGWVTTLHETGEGPHSNWKVLVGEKRS